MKRFDRAIKALVKGYINNTLKPAKCTACAVGNIIAECNNYTISENLEWIDSEDKQQYPEWINVFCTFFCLQTIKKENYIYNAKKEIDSTGYTWQELAKVEAMFERTKGDIFNKLMAVVEVLCEIENFDDVLIKETKELFIVNN